MIINYIDADGRIIELEVAEEIGSFYLTSLEEEKRNERRETRRHTSLSQIDFEGEWFSNGADILGDLIRTENREKVRSALAKLTPIQRELLDRVYIRNEKIIDIARNQGVSQPAISQRVATAIKRFIKYL